MLRAPLERESKGNLWTLDSESNQSGVWMYHCNRIEILELKKSELLIFFMFETDNYSSFIWSAGSSSCHHASVMP